MSQHTRLHVYRPDGAAVGETARIVWSATSDDLHANLVVLGPGEAIDEHVNAQLDVLLTCVDGTGTLTVNGEMIALQPGSIALIPRGTRRASRAGEQGLRYVTCHRQRGGLMPTLERPR